MLHKSKGKPLHDADIITLGGLLYLRLHYFSIEYIYYSGTYTHWLQLLFSIVSYIVTVYSARAVTDLFSFTTNFFLESVDNRIGEFSQE